MLALGLTLISLQWSLSPLVYPKATTDPPPSEFVSWAGFGYLPAQGRTVTPHFARVGDWSALQQEQNQAPAEKAVDWPIRFFVLKRVDRMRTLPDGTLYEEQCALETVDVERISRAVALMQRLVEFETHGTVRLLPQITVDSEPLVLGSRTLDRALDDYVRPRANGGRFQPEDHTYWGPYQEVVVFHPAPAAATLNPNVNGMPLQSMPVYGFPGYEAEGELALKLARSWNETVKMLSRRSGVLGPLTGIGQFDSVTGLPNPLAFVPEGNWSTLLKAEDLPGDEIEAREKLPTAPDSESDRSEKLMAVAYKGATCHVAVTADPEQGSALVYDERGEARNGGVEFPSVGASESWINPAKTPTLQLFARSGSKDPLALEFQSPDGKTYDVALGEDLDGETKLFQANLERDGIWHRIRLDLRQSGLTAISQIRLVPTPNALRHPKLTQGPVEYEFASFSVATDQADPPWTPPTPAPDSPDAWLRARWAHAAEPAPRLLALLKDPQWFVRLNAIQRYVDHPDPAAEAALSENAILDIDGPADAAAVDALWKLGTPSAKTTVRNLLKTGVTELGKAEAARLVAETKDPTAIQELSVLQQSRGLVARLAAVDALAQFAGETAAIARMTFLYQEDPQVKLEVTRTSDPNENYQWKKLLWSSVNEPSDAVRLASDEKLIASSDTTARDGGYAGVKDDSVQVRVQLLEYLHDHPSEANRIPLRRAVLDRSALVRAAAIRAFATLEKGATPDELGSNLQDRRPTIELALIEWMKVHKLVPDSELSRRLTESPDPQVKAALAP